MTKEPLITVFMPVYNGEQYLSQAVESVLSQTYQDFELLIIDDASLDKSFQIVKSYKDKNQRIRIYRNPQKLGLAKIRQRGVELSRGKYLAFLDCDDIAKPTRLEKQISFFSRHPQLAMLGSFVEVIDKEGKSTGKIWKHATSSKVIPIILMFRNCFTQSAVIIKKDCFQSFSYRSEYWAAPDYDLWTRLSRKYQMENIPEVLCMYRSFEKNMSKQDEEEIKNCTQRIHRNNIEFLGIEPSREEIIIHDSLERNTRPLEEENLIKIENWLIKLIDTNQSRKIFNEFFSVLVSDYWLKQCLLSANYGIKIWYRYLSSRIRNKKLLKNMFLLIFSLFRKSISVDVTSAEWLRYLYGY